VQSGSFLNARSHRLNLYIVPWVLISELQAFSQGIHKTSMVRPDSPIDPNDVVLTRQMSCDEVFHELPHYAAAIERRPTFSAAFPTL
jgi:hypothetical protein